MLSKKETEFLNPTFVNNENQSNPGYEVSKRRLLQGRYSSPYPRAIYMYWESYDNLRLEAIFSPKNCMGEHKVPH